MADALKSGSLPAVAKWFLFAVPPVVLVGGWLASHAAVGRLPHDPAGPYGNYLALYNPNPAGEEREEFERGRGLYDRHCANCHGANGDGKGPAPLTIPARHFGAERFRFTDTLNAKKDGGGFPTEEKLLALIERGIPGSAMPPFADLLSDADRRAVLGYVRGQFLKPGVLLEQKKQAAKKKAEASDDGFDAKSDWSAKKMEQWWKEAVAEVEPGTRLPAPEFPDPTPEALERGKVAFTKLGCANCHGKEGKGDGEQVKDPKFVNDNGTRARPRDLTAGVFKGGGGHADLYRRVYLGIPGTPMPTGGLTATQQELVDVVYFVRSLAEPKGEKVAAK